MLPTAIPRRLLAVAVLTVAVPLAACGEREDRVAQPLPRPSDAEQIRNVAKAISKSYAAEDYARLCAQIAPSTVRALIALGKVDSCEALFAKATTFSAPGPRQIDRAEVRIRGDRASLVFQEQDVEPLTLRRIDERWLIANKAEISKD